MLTEHYNLFIDKLVESLPLNVTGGSNEDVIVVDRYFSSGGTLRFACWALLKAGIDRIVPVGGRLYEQWITDISSNFPASTEHKMFFRLLGYKAALLV